MYANFSLLFCFQFNCRNTLDDQILENVTIEMESSEDFDIETVIPCPQLVYNAPGTTYTCVRIPSDPTSGLRNINANFFTHLFVSFSLLIILSLFALHYFVFFLLLILSFKFVSMNGFTK